jgi:hypothetical protein
MIRCWGWLKPVPNPTSVANECHHKTATVPEESWCRMTPMDMVTVPDDDVVKSFLDNGKEFGLLLQAAMAWLL